MNTLLNPVKNVAEKIFGKGPVVDEKTRTARLSKCLTCNQLIRSTKEVNAEHQEVLVLLKHKAFDTVETKSKEGRKHYTPTEKSNFVSGFTSLFALTNAQKKELAEQGKNIVNTLIDSLVMNNLKR